jgi:hypothetical protein
MEEDLKPIHSIMAVAAGFVLSLGMFAVGAGTAVYFIAIEPQGGPGSTVDVADLWTVTPRIVRSPANSLDRLPPHPGSVLSTPAVASATVGHSATLQVAYTGSDEIDLSPSAIIPTQQSQPPIGILAQHVAWCFDRYRSYRTDDDSYTAYAGGRRACVSPYTEILITWAEQSSPDLETAYIGDSSAAKRALLDVRFQHAMRDQTQGDPMVSGADTVESFYSSADAGIGLTDDHVSNCFDRYRSYRPEDNSYQPYGGGSRRQCE